MMFFLMMLGLVFGQTAVPANCRTCLEARDALNDQMCRQCLNQLNSQSWDLEQLKLCTEAGLGSPGCVCHFECTGEGKDPCKNDDDSDKCGPGTCAYGDCDCNGTGFSGDKCDVADDTCKTGNTAITDCSTCKADEPLVCTACTTSTNELIGQKCEEPDCMKGSTLVDNCAECDTDKTKCKTCAANHHLVGDACVVDDCMTGGNKDSNCTACDGVKCTECADGFEVKADICAKKEEAQDEKKDDSSAAAFAFSMIAAFAMLF